MIVLICKPSLLIGLLQSIVYYCSENMLRSWEVIFFQEFFIRWFLKILMQFYQPMVDQAIDVKLQDGTRIILMW